MSGVPELVKALGCPKISQGPVFFFLPPFSLIFLFFPLLLFLFSFCPFYFFFPFFSDPSSIFFSSFF